MLIVKYINRKSKINFRLYQVEFVGKNRTAILTPTGKSIGQAVVKMSLATFERASNQGFYIEQ